MEYHPRCQHFRSRGPQDFTLETGFSYGEDCLNLNIWTNANSSGAKLPVIIWSYPAKSTATNALFNGGGMASQGIVFINFNYRTGSLGWLATPKLNAEMEAVYGTNSMSSHHFWLENETNFVI